MSLYRVRRELPDSMEPARQPSETEISDFDSSNVLTYSHPELGKVSLADSCGESDKVIYESRRYVVCMHQRSQVRRFSQAQQVVSCLENADPAVGEPLAGAAQQAEALDE